MLLKVIKWVSYAGMILAVQPLVPDNPINYFGLVLLSIVLVSVTYAQGMNDSRDIFMKALEGLDKKNSDE